MMELLAAGLILFFGTHLIPSIPGMKSALTKMVGAKGYRPVFALLSFAGLVLIILGYQDKPIQVLHEWYAPHWARHLMMLAMLVAFILLPAAHMKTNIKRYTRHPMLWGIAIWSGMHLWLNGDHASILLFGSFLAYSLFAMFTGNMRGAKKQTKKVPLKNDIIVVVAGGVAYIAVAFSHQWIAGVSIMGG